MSTRASRHSSNVSAGSNSNSNSNSNNSNSNNSNSTALTIKVKDMTNQDTVYIGDKRMVMWKSGQKYPAEIVAKRAAKDSSTKMEFYVHYIDYDRRLDEWVTIDRIDCTSLVGESPSNNKNKKAKRKFGSSGDDDVKHEDKLNMAATIEKEHEEITRVKNIQSIIFGRYDMATWYFSPYPDDYCGEEKLHICERCLKYMIKRKTLEQHKKKCEMFHPPGVEIYREHDVVMYEVDGKENKLYCQNLCLLSKLFLDHKTLYYDVDPFLFYVLCEIDYEFGEELRIVGYFSKEKQSQENYNLACILTFPSYQRKGYGKLLISISFELTKREGTTGSPEKPLSDLGKISYRSYWTYVIMDAIQKIGTKNVTSAAISAHTGVRHEDVVSTMHYLNLIKYWKGQHVLSVRDDVVAFHLAQQKKIRLCDPNCLVWQPPDKASSSSSSAK